MVQSGPGRPGFIASYVGAFHRPVPHRLPLAVVAPPDGSGKVVAELNAIPGRPLHASAAPSMEAGTSELLRRNVYGVLFVDIRATSHRLIEASASGVSAASAMAEVMQLAEAQVHRSFCVDDIRPPLPGDRNSLTSFYLVIGWIVGGYLVAAILGVSTGTRPANANWATVRLSAVAVYALVTGLLGALLVFCAGAFSMGLQVVAGTIGIGTDSKGPRLSPRNPPGRGDWGSAARCG